MEAGRESEPFPVKGGVSLPYGSPCYAVFMKYQVSAFSLHLAACQVRRSPSVINQPTYFKKKKTLSQFLFLI